MNRTIQDFIAYTRETFVDVSPKDRKFALTWELYHQFQSALPPDSFCQIVAQVDGLKLQRCINLENVLGYRIYSYEEHLRSFHPHHLSVYLQYVLAKREIEQPRMPPASRQPFFCSILVPLRNELDFGQYWWVRQIAYPMKYTVSGRITAWLYLYRLSHRYDQQTLMQPAASVPELEKELILRIGGYFLGRLCRRITPRQKLLLHTYYCRLRQLRVQFPSVRDIAGDVGLTTAAVHKYNQELLRSGRQVFPFVAFRSVEDLIRFLHRFLGNIGEKDFRAILP